MAGDKNSVGKKPRGPYSQPRKLITWDLSKDQHLLLALVYECDRRNLSLPLEDAMQHICPGSSVEAARQHFSRVRQAREHASQPVPPHVPRAKQQPTANAADGASGGNKKRGRADGSQDDVQGSDRRPPGMSKLVYIAPNKRAKAINIAPKAAKQTETKGRVPQAEVPVKEPAKDARGRSRRSSAKTGRKIIYDEDDDEFEAPDPDCNGSQDEWTPIGDFSKKIEKKSVTAKPTKNKISTIESTVSEPKSTESSTQDRNNASASPVPKSEDYLAENSVAGSADTANEFDHVGIKIEPAENVVSEMAAFPTPFDNPGASKHTHSSVANIPPCNGGSSHEVSSSSNDPLASLFSQPLLIPAGGFDHLGNLNRPPSQRPQFVGSGPVSHSLMDYHSVGQMGSYPQWPVPTFPQTMVYGQPFGSHIAMPPGAAMPQTLDMAPYNAQSFGHSNDSNASTLGAPGMMTPPGTSPVGQGIGPNIPSTGAPGMLTAEGDDSGAEATDALIASPTIDLDDDFLHEDFEEYVNDL